MLECLPIFTALAVSARCPSFQEGWHRYFTWPEGVTAWAIILTLCAITWQAWETRRSVRETGRSVQAARKQARISRRALIAQFRPKIRVRAIHISQTENSLSVKVIVYNKGGSAGHIIKSNITLSWLFTYSEPSPIGETAFQPVSLHPGEDKPLQIDLSGSWIEYKFSIDEAEKKPSYPGMRLRCEGVIVYTDDNGTTRKTGFSRLRDHSTNSWIICDDREYEYHD